MTTLTHIPIELDFRAQDGVEVALLWYADRDVVAVNVFDSRVAQAFELVVDAEEALDVFRHPFAYAAFRGVPLAVTSAEEDAEPLAA
jgi:hypothetical protein